jgi:hypothetical protein
VVYVERGDGVDGGKGNSPGTGAVSRVYFTNGGGWEKKGSRKYVERMQKKERKEGRNPGQTLYQYTFRNRKVETKSAGSGLSCTTIFSGWMASVLFSELHYHMHLIEGGLEKGAFIVGLKQTLALREEREGSGR